MTDGGEQLPPNAPMAKGKDAVKKEWAGSLGLKDVAVKWEPTSIQVAEKREIGYTSGAYLRSTTPTQRDQSKRQRQVSPVWEKVDGKWKCDLDMYSPICWQSN